MLLCELALQTRKHNCTAIGLALILCCVCSKRVRVFPVAYNVCMQTVSKSLINQVLNTGILSDTLKIYKRNDTSLFEKYNLVSSSNYLKIIRDIFRQTVVSSYT